MAVVGTVLIIVAAILHSWYAGSARHPIEPSRAFAQFGLLVLFLTIILLVTGVLFIWLGSGFLTALAAAGVYFFVLPLVILPLLQRAGLVPRAFGDD